MPEQPADNQIAPAGSAYLRRNLVWRTLHVILAPFFAFWVRTHAWGIENIDDTQGGLLLLNHQSYLDPLVAAYPLRRPISYLARDGLFKVPMIGWILRKSYVQSISQTAFRASGIRTAVDRMHQGFLVGIFPEGSRSCGAVKTFHRGFLALVRRTDVPIYPVGIVNADHCMPRGAFFIRPGRIDIVFGKPLTAEECEQLRSGNDDSALTEMMRRRVDECMQFAHDLRLNRQ